jgi:hypothetical protein
MGSHVVMRRRPEVSLNAQAAHVRFEAARKWRTDVIAKVIFEGQRRIWMTEEAATHVKHRSLLDDNPAAG